MIFVTGDTHADNQQRVYDLILKATTKKYLERPAGTDYLIVLGDCGIFWKPSEKDSNIAALQVVLKKYTANTGRKLEFLFLSGNHENFDMLNKLQKVERFGSEVGMLAHGIYNLLTGNIYTIENQVLAVFGGALSIDKADRIEGVSWWREEIPAYSVQEAFIEKLSNIAHVDYLLTHTTSSKEIYALDMYPFSGKLTDSVAEYLRIVKTMFPDLFKHHYFGHFHMDATVESTNSTCLYNVILELGQKI